MSLFANRPRLIHVSLALFAVAVIGRAAKVQLIDKERWRTRAKAQQVAHAPAPRGVIRDANGEVLVESRAMVQLRVVPKDIKERARLRTLLSGIKVPTATIARATDTTKGPMELPGAYLPTDVAALTALRGVYPRPVLNRVAPRSEGLRRVIGRTNDGGDPVDGVELALDTLLRGQAGREKVLLDRRGRPIALPEVDEALARPGHTVTLTINAGLQDIAERALNDAVEAQGAAGGDIVILDVRSGEVRALASRRSDVRSTAATSLTEPYEPGSTLKPFVAAWLLEHKRARLDEVVDGHNGKWNLNGRIIEDDHKAASFTFTDVIRFSSNIGIIQLAQRLTSREQFEVLRDAGFGAPTGTTYPSESPGRLAPPALWSQKSSASLAMGYEILVTPMQLAAAYAAIANGGELLQPALVREVRTPEGQVVYAHQRRVVRRLMSVETARTMRLLLKGVIEGGTAQGASLATFEVAGKTGTAKVARNKRYVAGEYTASFVGMFPADNPQIVILVKLDSPRKSIYGGKAAAPVSKTVLEAAIAARDAALDRAGLAGAPKGVAATPPVVASSPTPNVAPNAPMEIEVVVTESAGSVPYLVALDQPLSVARVVAGARAVPSVYGLSRRDAARALHRAGFRVTFANGSPSQSPAAGTLALAGSRVTVMVAP